MGMGTWGVNVEAISADNLKKICPEGFSELDEKLKSVNASWGDLAMVLQYGGGGDCIEDAEEEDLTEIADLWAALCYDFEKKTELELSATHYDEGSGDRYDEAHDHEGMIFTLDGVYKMTPAAERMKDMIEYSRFTVWG